jgi:hypothetical protein
MDPPWRETILPPPLDSLNRHHRPAAARRAATSPHQMPAREEHMDTAPLILFAQKVSTSNRLLFADLRQLRRDILPDGIRTMTAGPPHRCGCAVNSSRAAHHSARSIPGLASFEPTLTACSAFRTFGRTRRRRVAPLREDAEGVCLVLHYNRYQPSRGISHSSPRPLKEGRAASRGSRVRLTTVTAGVAPCPRRRAA